MPKAIGVKKPHDCYKDNNRPQIFSMKNANANAFKSLSHISYYFASHLCSLLGCLIVLFLFLYRYQRHWFIPHCGLCHSAFHACCVMCNQSAHIFAYILKALKPSCAKLRYLGTNCKFFGPKVKSTCPSLQKSQYLDGNIKYQGTITCWAYWSVSSYVFRSIKLNPCLLNQNNAIKQQDILVFLLNINCLQYMKFVNNHKIQMVYFSYRSPIILRSFSFVLVRSRSFSFVLVRSRSGSVLVRFSFGSRSVLVRFSISSRSVLDHPSFILRSFSVRESKIDRRTNGESSEARRRCIETLMGGEGKDDPNILVLQNAFEKTRK